MLTIMIRKYPLVIYWVLGHSIMLAGYFVGRNFDLYYDDGHIGTAIFFFGAVILAPITAVGEGIFLIPFISRDDLLLEILLSFLVFLGLQIVLKKMLSYWQNR